MALTIHSEYNGEIQEFIKRFPAFSFIKTTAIPQDDNIKWFMNNSLFNYSNKEVYKIQAMFIGKTGYGKSTTLNKIVGNEVFESNSISVCTKDLYCANYRINKEIPTFLTFSDLPGIGESNCADNQYYQWYKDMFLCSHVVVYILRADQRDFSVDEVLFKNMFSTKAEKEKVILALNYSDKVEPIQRRGDLSVEQIANIKKKVEEVSRIFGIQKNDIVYYSAADSYNIDVLISKVAQKIKKQLDV